MQTVTTIVYLYAAYRFIKAVYPKVLKLAFILGGVSVAIGNRVVLIKKGKEVMEELDATTKLRRDNR